MEIPILYEDDSLLVINKPAGIVVNRALTVKETTIEDWAQARHKEQLVNDKEEEKDFSARSGIVHRLDKETSGILLIAKTPAAFRQLQHQFKARVIKKTYLAIVHGKVVPAQGEIRAPVGRLPWNRTRFGIVPGGKEALTNYKSIKHPVVNIKGKKEELTLLELYPETGRTHQLRVHLKYINHPVVGDYLYAGRKVSRADRRWAPRVMLHAWKISFPHPVTNNQLAFAAPIPDDMNSTIHG